MKAARVAAMLPVVALPTMQALMSSVAPKPPFHNTYTNISMQTLGQWEMRCPRVLTRFRARLHNALLWCSEQHWCSVDNTHGGWRRTRGIPASAAASGPGRPVMSTASRLPLSVAGGSSRRDPRDAAESSRRTGKGLCPSLHRCAPHRGVWSQQDRTPAGRRSQCVSRNRHQASGKGL